MLPPKKHLSQGNYWLVGVRLFYFFMTFCGLLEGCCIVLFDIVDVIAFFAGPQPYLMIFCPSVCCLKQPCRLVMILSEWDI